MVQRQTWIKSWFKGKVDWDESNGNWVDLCATKYLEDDVSWFLKKPSLKPIRSG